MKMIVVGAEHQEPSLFPLRKHDARNDAERCQRRCNRAIVRQPDGDVKADRLTRWLATGEPTARMRTIVGRWFAIATTQS